MLPAQAIQNNSPNHATALITWKLSSCLLCQLNTALPLTHVNYCVRRISSLFEPTGLNMAWVWDERIQIIHLGTAEF